MEKDARGDEGGVIGWRGIMEKDARGEEGGVIAVSGSSSNSSLSMGGFVTPVE